VHDLDRKAPKAWAEEAQCTDCIVRGIGQRKRKAWTAKRLSVDDEVHVIDSKGPKFGQRKREAWTAKRWSVGRGGARHRQ